MTALFLNVFLFPCIAEKGFAATLAKIADEDSRKNGIKKNGIARNKEKLRKNGVNLRIKVAIESGT